ncbi:ATP-dependent DNA ligase [Kitasatospora sp. NPDC092948]|uniref:ATP-dependent DNA ligase n=1 Tax=Kitasatospora sp. NPDC092948 TaxID=3364088 RepID=UPI0038061165
MTSWALPEPMLTEPVSSPDLPAGWAAEPKWDGYRAQLATGQGGRVVLRSRRGAQMAAAFPEIVRAARQLDEGCALDGELVVWEGGRLAFERLRHRLASRGARAEQAAKEWPAHYVAFDLLHDGEEDLTGWPYWRRRAALEGLFAALPAAGPLALCPSTTEPAVADEWLGWTAAGLEGLCFKRSDERYLPGRRAWRKYKVRTTAETIIGAVTGSIAAPGTVLLGRRDPDGHLRYVGRTITLNPVLARDVGGWLTPAQARHPWTGWTFSASWGGRETLDVRLVDPEVVLEISADTARDSTRRWRHPVRAYRVRTDLAPGDLPPP